MKAEDAGTVSNTPVTSGETVYQGTTVLIEFAPQKGYRLADGSLKYNGTAIPLIPGGSTAETATATGRFTMPATPVTVTAETRLIDYQISYELDGATNFDNAPASYTVETADITLGTPTKASYTFDGWYSEATFTNKMTRIASGSTGDSTLYAKWTATPYTITYHLDGGTNYAGALTSYNVETPTITLGTPTRPHYVFDGWYEEAAFNTKVTSIEKGSTGPLQLYAKWHKVRITAIGTAALQAFTLSTAPTTAAEVIDSLKLRYPTVTATQENGYTTVLPLSWALTGTTFKDKSQEVNNFTWTATAPDSLDVNGKTLTGIVDVTNPKFVLIEVEQDKPINIPDDSPSVIIKGDGSTTAPSLTIPGNSGDKTIKTEDVKTETLTAGSGTKAEIQLTGNNALGTVATSGPLTLNVTVNGTVTATDLIINAGGSLTIQSADNRPLTGTNNLPSEVTLTPGSTATSFLTDNTGTIRTVMDGTGATANILLALTSTLPASIVATPNQPATLTLTVNLGEGYQITYILQKLINGLWVDQPSASKSTQLKAATPSTYTHEIPSDQSGTYRIQAKAVPTNATGSGKAEITLHTAPVTVTAGSDPTPPATTYHTVTLPAVEGAILSPGAGAHSVAAGESFSFTLTLDANYDQSVPVVTVNGNALTPDANGKYTIADISANLTVAITGIVRNTTTGIEQVENATLIRAESGALLIRTPISVTAQVIALTGNVVRTVRLPTGDSRVDGLASGIYIVRLSNKITKKVMIR